LRDLAREIWWLQPPFRRDIASLPTGERFEIRFVGAEDAFRAINSTIAHVGLSNTAPSIASLPP